MRSAVSRLNCEWPSVVTERQNGVDSGCAKSWNRAAGQRRQQHDDASHGEYSEIQRIDERQACSKEQSCHEGHAHPADESDTRDDERVLQHEPYDC